MSVFIGIDPGKTGAVAIMVGNVVTIYDFGDVRIPSKLLTLTNLFPGATHAVLEKVHSMPGQGVSSTFKFGESFGWWKGALDAINIPYDLITPQRWQKEMFDFKPAKGNRTAAEWAKFRKELSLERARRLYPEAKEEYLARKKDHNRADALLIAGYCKMKYSSSVKSQ
jgi:crossover junction endodeoxyribonuclease RuvC